MIEADARGPDARLWAAGSLVSVLAHVAFAGLLLATLPARPPAYVAEPAAGPDIALHAATPDRLRSATARSEALGEAQNGIGRSAFTAPPRSRAGAVLPSSRRLAPVVSAGMSLAPSEHAEPLSAAVAVPNTIAETAPLLGRLAALSPSAELVRNTAPSIRRLGAIDSEGSTLEVGDPVSATTQSVQPVSAPLEPVIDSAALAPAAAPSRHRIVASDYDVAPSAGHDPPERRLRPVAISTARMARDVPPANVRLNSAPTDLPDLEAAVASPSASAVHLSGIGPVVQPLAPEAPGGPGLDAVPSGAERASAASVTAAAGPARAAGSAQEVSGSLPPANLAVVSEAGQAAAAWSGGSNARLDPRSLEAIRAFVTPAAVQGAPSVRDGLDAALSGLPCSRLSAAFSPERGEIVVRGHARDAETAEAAIAGVGSAVGPSIPVVADLRILPAPQCAMLDALDRTGLPQSSDQLDNPLVVGRASQLVYRPMEEGEAMRFSLGAAEFDAYLYLDYFDAFGQVIHITPSHRVPLRRLRTGEEVQIGDAGPDGLGIGLTVGPPFGKDLLLAIATSHPLDRAGAPAVEDGLRYLTQLRTRIAAARAAEPDFRGEWVYVFVETFARGTAPAR